jgi:hypothetical protein
MQLQIASAVFMFEKWLSGDARDLVMGGEKKNALWQRELLTLHETKTSVRTGKCYLVTRQKQSWTCSCVGAVDLRNTVRRTVHLQVGKVTKVIVGG